MNTTTTHTATTHTATRSGLALFAAAVTLALTAMLGATADVADRADGQTYGEVLAGRRSP